MAPARDDGVQASTSSQSDVRQGGSVAASLEVTSQFTEKATVDPKKVNGESGGVSLADSAKCEVYVCF